MITSLLAQSASTRSRHQRDDLAINGEGGGGETTRAEMYGSGASSCCYINSDFSPYSAPEKIRHWLGLAAGEVRAVQQTPYLTVTQYQVSVHTPVLNPRQSFLTKRSGFSASVYRSATLRIATVETGHAVIHTDDSCRVTFFTQQRIGWKIRYLVFFPFI